MKGKFRPGLAIIGVLAVLVLTGFIFTSTVEAAAPAPWTGDPDPYECNFWLDCYWTVKVCIAGQTYKVGIYYDPATATNTFMEDDALFYGTKLTIGKCEFSYTGRWVHSYAGKTWTCNLVSEEGEDKNAARFSDINYVRETCGEHPTWGPFDGTADYMLCREKSSDGTLFCGNKYDTSY